MGKRFKALSAKETQRGLFPWYVWLAIAASVLLVFGLAALVYLNFFRPQPALPTATEVQLPPLPAGPPLPQKRVEAPAAPSLPEAPAKAPVQPALPQAPPPPEKKEPAGTVTWAWQLYEINPTLVVGLGDKMPGYMFVALGVTVWNNSTEKVPFGNEHNEFTLIVDNKIYTAEIWSTASAVISGLPYMVPTTLGPNSSVGGYTVFLIPKQFGQIMAQWRINLPPTVKIVRLDPKVPVIRAQAMSPAAPAPAPVPPPSKEENE